MGKPLVLLFSLITIIILGVSTQVTNSTDSKEIEIRENPEEIKKDTLLEWMTFMKNESRRFLNEGNLEKSLSHLTRCIEKRWREPSSFEEREKLGWVYTNRAYFYETERGDFLAAKEDYLSALEQFELCEPSDFYVARFVYQPLGNIYTRLGENELALSILEDFRRVSEESNETQALMNAHNDIGRAYVNTGQLDTAILVMESGIELDDSDDFSLCLLYSSKAEAEEENGMLEQSFKSSKKCLYHVNRLLNSVDPSDYQYNAAKRYKIEALKAESKVLGHSGRLNEVKAICEEVLSLTAEVYPEKHRAHSRALVELGNSYEALGMKTKAIECYQLSLKAMLDNVSLDDFSQNPSKSQLFADVILGQALILKATVAHDKYIETSDASWLNISVEAFLAYFEWVEIQRSEQFEFNSKLETANETHQNGEAALRSIFDLYTLTKDDKWIDTAFVLMDQTKAIVLAEERGVKNLGSQNPKMRSLLKQQSALKAQRAYFIEDIRDAKRDNRAEDLSRLKKRLSELDKQSQLLDQDIRSLFPSYRTETSAKLVGETLGQLNVKLKNRKTSVLSYFVGDKLGYVITGSPGNFEFAQFSRQDLTLKTVSFMEELNAPNSSIAKDYSKSGKLLFDLLVGDMADKLDSSWLILPDGILNSFPFEALVSNAEGNSFKKLNYLVHDYIIHYAPSAFFFVYEGAREKAKQPFLGIAPVFKTSKSYDYLPKSKEELASGASLFSGDELTGAKATKKQFFKKAENYDILHISTHAGTNTGNNNDAWMVFSDAKSDHKLEAHELLKLDLPASLVVLNACETGSGTVFKGEGPMSLARGFLNAGSESTVTNLWSVNHESNAAIMKSFYENLSESLSPAESLSKAKQAYLASNEIDNASAHPYYWSSAILVGTDAQVMASSSSSWVVWVSLGTVLLSVLGLAWFRKRKLKRAT